MSTNNPETIVRLLRHIAAGSQAKENKHDVIFNAAADLLVQHAAGVGWAVARWNAEVKHRPLCNRHRRTLDDTWRQVIRHFGGDDRALIGPTHDELVNA